jgi:hypothetical protein
MSAWPSEDNPIARVRYSLLQLAGDEEDVYSRGTVDSREELERLQSILAPLSGLPMSVASEPAGELVLELQDGTAVIILPVFHRARARYGDLFFADNAQYGMPPALAELLEDWRRR